MGNSVRQGDYVRHNNMPNWGVGQVLAVAEGYLQVQFRHGLVKLKASIAGPLLSKASAAEFDGGKTPLRKGRASSSAARSKPCVSCARPLNVAQRSADLDWKSCPECSVQDGREHVFLPYPSAFGVTQLRATDADPDGAQNYCTGCRGKGERNADRRLCSHLKSQRLAGN